MRRAKLVCLRYRHRNWNLWGSFIPYATAGTVRDRKTAKNLKKDSGTLVSFRSTPPTGRKRSELGHLVPTLDIVNLGGKDRLVRRVGCREVTSGCCRCLPHGEGSQTQKSMIRRFQQVPSHSEEILDHTVMGEKPLCVTSRFESAHLPFSLAGRLMRDFGAVVCVSFCAVGDFA